MKQKLMQLVVTPFLAVAPMLVASLDPRLFLADARCVVLAVFVWIALVVENSLFDPKTATESKGAEHKKRDRRSFELAILTNLACFYLPVFEYFHLPMRVPRDSVTLAIGLALMIGGEGLRVSALSTLGRFFTVRVAVLKGHKVVRGGLYRFVRHPAYTGWFLSSLGIGLYLGSLIGILGTSLFIVVIGWRVKVEEAALSEVLGEEYRGYMRDVPRRFIPGIF